MKLISMTDFVFEQKKRQFYGQIESSEILQTIYNYTEFLKQPLTLGMFVPCDENGNVLKEPILGREPYSNNEEDFKSWERDYKKYNEAKEMVLFKGWIYTGGKCVKCGMFQYNLDRNEYSNIESLLTFKQAVKYLELTESAINQLVV